MDATATRAEDKPDNPSDGDIPLFIKCLSGDIPTDKPWIKDTSWRARSEKQLCEIGHRVLCLSHRATPGKTHKKGQKKSKAF